MNILVLLWAWALQKRVKYLDTSCVRALVCVYVCVCVYKRRAHLYKLRRSGAGYVWFVFDSPGLFHEAFQC